MTHRRIFDLFKYYFNNPNEFNDNSSPIHYIMDIDKKEQYPLSCFLVKRIDIQDILIKLSIEGYIKYTNWEGTKNNFKILKPIDIEWSDLSDFETLICKFKK